MNAVGPDLSWAMVVMATAVVVFLLLLVVFILLVMTARRRQRSSSPPSELTIDVRQLPAGGPPGEGPTLEFYGMPVRLVVVVLAPAGRNAQLPPENKLASVLDDLSPGLSSVVLSHRPVLRMWPSQLSTQGFIHAFFNNLQLPGDRGKGTPWCSAAGRFDAGDQQLLAGILCAADKPNSLSQVTIANVGQWMEVVRVRS
jgi:hypothetical protein